MVIGVISVIGYTAVSSLHGEPQKLCQRLPGSSHENCQNLSGKIMAMNVVSKNKWKWLVQRGSDATGH